MDSNKTILVFASGPTTNTNTYLGNHLTSRCTYSGSQIIADGKSSQGIKRKIGQARTAWKIEDVEKHQKKRTLISKKISRSVQISF